MISYLTRNDLDTAKYDACIANAINSRIYAFSLYLDSVADNWDVLVLNDYEAVMPLPWREKYTVKYCYTPFWLLELGVFFTDKKHDSSIFLKEAFTKFKFIELRLNTENLSDTIVKNGIEKQFQYLNLKTDVQTNYRKDRIKDLKKAEKNGLKAVWDDDAQKLIHLFRENVGKRTPNITNKDYTVLEKLIMLCIEKQKGEILSIYKDENLVASGFFLKHNGTATILISSTDFSNRDNGANTFLINTAINKYKKDYSEFNFGGSSITSIADYFKSFGANSKNYYLLKHNNLPKVLRFFKK